MNFHPAVQTWFDDHFPALTDAQAAAWPLIQAGRSVLVAAPTGSGKTLTAFLAVIDELLRQGLSAEGLPAGTQVVYVSPLKALSNDIQVNLQAPLAGIAAELQRQGLPPVAISAAVRTGDTPQRERAAMRRQAPQILVTTPESLYVLLGSASGRQMLASTGTVIVDEIHAIAAGKRGSHLALSLERLEALCSRPLRRIGLSATQRPIEAVAQLLVGAGRNCEIVDVGHQRPRDLALELPEVPLSAVMANDVWESVYRRLAQLAREHRTTLVFVNTRRMAERLARHLSEQLGRDAVAAHHGSLAREQRLDAEQRLKHGQLKVLVATASLELGIDIGAVELVCQIGSPGSIAAFLQRVGRSDHWVGGTPKGRLFATTRDDLVQGIALFEAIRLGELDLLRIPVAPLDVLAQQIVAEVSCQDWDEHALFDCLRKAAPYHALDPGHYQALLRMLAEGYASAQGQRAVHLHRDAVNQRLRGRRGSQLTAVTSGGAIPDNADYSVVLEPQGLSIGTVNEDFAIESIAGDVFQLGNTPYRILRVERGKVRVEDAAGQAPNIPFWLGEVPGRSDQLSLAVARIQDRADGLLANADASALARDLAQRADIDTASAQPLADWLSETREVLGALPSQDCLIMERFFDASGGTQLIIHSPYGSRVNRAWGLALRKRFCRTFNFELQAAASEDAIILSLSTSHSFPLEEVWRYLHSNSAEAILIQAVLEAPLFNVRWRWTAGIALALPRYAGGRKIAPQIQRMRSEDLVAQVFPDQIACFENLAGEREVPDHPLVEQTLDDCLHEALDTRAWLALLKRMEAGDVRLICRDLPAPSPLAATILAARPYSFLDDAPLEERRTQAVQARRWSDPRSSDDLGALDAAAIDAVAAEAWPEPRNVDEMHEALMGLAVITEAEAAAQLHWPEWLGALQQQQRAVWLEGGLWIARERLVVAQALYPERAATPTCAPLPGFDQPLEPEAAAVDLLRARLSGFAPQSLAQIAAPLLLSASVVDLALVSLEREGYVLRGHFHPGRHELQWCERHLLARIHRYTLGRLRREIEPVSLQDFMRFSLDWQHLTPDTRLRGATSLGEVLAQLEGWAAPAPAWEQDILPARVADYASHWLDEACRAGRCTWARLGSGGRGGQLRATPVVLLPRTRLNLWRALLPTLADDDLSPRSQRVLAALRDHGALFFDELTSEAHLLRSELENALQELVASGLVHADSFAGLRALSAPAAKRQSRGTRRGRGAFIGGMDDAGRWSLLRAPGAAAEGDEALEAIALSLLRRYGVVFWRVLEREGEWLPSWRELLRIYHRLEARGQVRGGRFVDGLAGEQFALPEAVTLLRQVRKRPLDGRLVRISACDPLNLIGTLLPGTKVPALAGNHLLLRDGVPVATHIGGKIEVLVDVSAEEMATLRVGLRSGI